MESIVLFPSPGMGHLKPMVELGNLILTQNPSLSVHILIATPPFNLGNTTPYINKISATTPSLIFHHLPTISDDLPQDLSGHFIPSRICYFLRLNNPNVHNLLQSLSQSSNVRAFVLDIFCTHASALGFQLNIPTYLYWVSGASSLCSFLYNPTIHRNTTKSLKDLDELIEIPGLPPIPAKDMPTPLLDRTTLAYEYLMEGVIDYVNSAGILVNTFESLEPMALKAICDGLCCVPGHPTPPIFCLGPGFDADTKGGGTREGECLTWLDSQPNQSVVYINFGSMGSFSVRQLREIAIGLERSGQKFLWVVRSPPPDENNEQFLEADPDLNSILPDGFLDRTKERGLVVKKWAPQMAILNHGSVGGIVFHCGWNTVLEAVSAGVPMIAWPLFADNHLNARFLVEDVKLALPMNESEGRLVTAAEIEKRVRELMNSEEGNSVKKRVIAKRDEARVAMSEGGSSRFALAKWTESWKHK